MKVSLTTASFCLLAALAYSAVRAEEGDTLKTYVLDELVVSATRAEILRSSAPSSVTTINHQQIAGFAGTTLADALETVPGVSFRSYGGSGALHSLSIRGMAAEHTLVLVDGLRLTSYQNGQTDLGILLSSTVDRIEVVKGGHSSLYGADALGGVVNIVSRSPVQGLRGNVTAGRGSFGFQAEEISLEAADSTLGGSVLVRRERGTEDYGFDFDDGQHITRLARSNGDYRLISLDTGLEWRPMDGVQTGLRWTFWSAERGSPGPVFSTDPKGKARLTDRTHRIHGFARWRTSGSVNLGLHASYLRSYELYTDPDLLVGDIPLSSEYTNSAITLAPELQYAPSPFLTGVIGLELVRAGLRSKAVNAADRSQQSVFLSTQHVLPLGSRWPTELIIYPSLRYDHFSDFGHAWSPRLGVNLGIIDIPRLRLRGSIGESFRAPTFNDLYWREGGNPKLKPERSLSLDGGVIVSFEGFNVDVGAFTMRTTDRIVWIPGRGGIWSPVNVSDVRSRGVEAEITWRGWDGIVQATLNSTWTSSIKNSADYPGDPTEGKELIYVPRQTVHALVLIALRPMTFAVKHSWSSYRYTTEINDRYLPQHGVTSAAVTLEQVVSPLRTSLKLEVTNLFNTSYQIMAYYPMPPREIRCTLGVAL